MAGFRRRRKSGGFTRTSTDKGWTTSSSYGAGKKDGVGYRVTTTRKANGKTIIRTTERGGGGWFKTTQKTLSSKDPYKITQRDLNKMASGGSLFGDLADLISGIASIFSSKDSETKPTEYSQQTQPPKGEKIETASYTYKLQYSINGGQWYYCEGNSNTFDTLERAKERLNFKQYGTTVNKYRIVRINKEGLVEQI